jgi:hypothetical protein
MLFDVIKEVEQKANVTSSMPAPRRLDAADEEVMQNFVERVRQQIWPKSPQRASRRQARRKRDCRFRRGHPTASAF